LQLQKCFARACTILSGSRIEPQLLIVPSGSLMFRLA